MYILSVFPLLPFGKQQLTWITAEINPPDIRLSVTLCRDHIDVNSPGKDEKTGAGQMFLSVSPSVSDQFNKQIKGYDFVF